MVGRRTLELPMTRLSLLLGAVVTTTACSQSSDSGNAGPSAWRQREDQAEPKAVEVDFRFARVVEQHPALEGLVDFIKRDGAAADEFEGIQLREQSGSDFEEIILEGANRDAVQGYLESVFLRKPELEPEGFDLAFGTRPGRDPLNRWATASTRAYWLEKESQIEVTQIRSATVVNDSFGEQSIQLMLGDRDREAFGRLTTAAVGHKIAIARNDDVISAPVVNEPITGGELRISTGNPSGPNGADGPEALARKLFGDTANLHGLEPAEEDSIGGLRWIWNRWNEP